MRNYPIMSQPLRDSSYSHFQVGRAIVQGNDALQHINETLFALWYGLNGQAACQEVMLSVNDWSSLLGRLSVATVLIEGQAKVRIPCKVLFSRWHVCRNEAQGWCRPRTVTPGDVFCDFAPKNHLVTGADFSKEFQASLWAVRDSYNTSWLQTFQAIWATVNQWRGMEVVSDIHLDVVS